MSTASKVIARTDTQTHKHDENTAYAGGKNSIVFLKLEKDMDF